jgi:site-specific recombinase XerD
MEHDLSFHTLVPLYLDACEAEGKTPKTLAAYSESLTLYLRLVETEGLPYRVDEVTPPDVYRFIAAVRRRGVCDATQHRRHRELKHFFSWLKRMEIVPGEPLPEDPAHPP